MSTKPSTPANTAFFGLSYGWSYVLTSFTLVICGCLPLALLATMHTTGTGAERAQALMTALPIMAGLIAVVCALVFYTVLRTRPHWRRHAQLIMWGLAALGMVGWWKL